MNSEWNIYCLSVKKKKTLKQLNTYQYVPSKSSLEEHTERDMGFRFPFHDGLYHHLSETHNQYENV